MRVVEVFADVACPFTHAGLRRFVAYRQQQGVEEPRLRVRAWPLEFVNGERLQGPALAPKIAALKTDVADDLFVAFDADRFPHSSQLALAAEVAAREASDEVGERFSLVLRTALFEEGVDIGDAQQVFVLCDRHGVPRPTEAHKRQVQNDYDEGKQRGVKGSPHFFIPNGGDFFCPSMDIEHHGEEYEVTFDRDGFDRFVSNVFAT